MYFKSTIVTNYNNTSGSSFTIKGEGKIIEEDFSAILSKEVLSLSSGNDIHINIDVRPGMIPKFTMKGQKNLLDNFIFTIDDGKLSININESYVSSEPIQLVLNLPKLEQINLSGVEQVKGAVSGQSLKINQSGAGNVNLSGRVENLNIKISGSSDVHLGNLQSSNAEVTISGMGHAQVWADDSFKANVSGMGDITVFGDPEKFEKKISGMGNIAKSGGKKTAVKAPEASVDLTKNEKNIDIVKQVKQNESELTKQEAFKKKLRSML